MITKIAIALWILVNQRENKPYRQTFSGDMKQRGNMTPPLNVQQNGSPNTDTTQSELDGNGNNMIKAAGRY